MDLPDDKCQMKIEIYLLNNDRKKIEELKDCMKEMSNKKKQTSKQKKQEKCTTFHQNRFI